MSTRTIAQWFAVLIAFGAANAVAVQRTFVASYGVTANTAFNCSLAKPCRAFSEALGVTSADGEVIVLDSAGYGPVTITQSVSIIAPAGIYAGVTVTSGDGITINAPAGIVRLKGLTVNGQGGNNGIVFQDGARLAIESCTVTKMTNNGINLMATGGFTAISDVVASSNSEASRNISAGVSAMASVGATTRLSIDGLAATGNQSGLNAGAPAPGGITIVDAVRANLSGNTIDGVEMYGPLAFGQVIVSLTDSQVAANGLRGIFMSAPPSPKWSFTMSGNKIVNHSMDGVLNMGGNGLFLTRGENTINANSPNVSATLTPLGGL